MAITLLSVCDVLYLKFFLVLYYCNYLCGLIGTDFSFFFLWSHVHSVPFSSLFFDPFPTLSVPFHATRQACQIQLGDTQSTVNFSGGVQSRASAKKCSSCLFNLKRPRLSSNNSLNSLYSDG